MKFKLLQFETLPFLGFLAKALLWVVLPLTFNTVSFSEEPNHKPAVNTIKSLSVPVYSQETKKEYFDVVEDTLVSIGEHNFRLTQHARIGQTIAKRDDISFPQATVIHFCNLNYAKELLEMAPDYLLRMPCRISIRETKSKSTIVEVWLLPEDDKRTTVFAKKINAILINIVKYAST